MLACLAAVPACLPAFLLARILGVGLPDTCAHLHPPLVLTRKSLVCVSCAHSTGQALSDVVGGGPLAPPTPSDARTATRDVGHLACFHESATLLFME